MSESTTEKDFLAENWAAPTVYRNDLFTGEVALVAGGGSGIGAATALLFVRLGATVVICGRNPDKLDAVAAFAGEHGADVEPVAANVRDPEQVDALFARVGDQFGRLDKVVNSAGGHFPQHAIDYSDKGWRAVVDTNLNGSWNIMQRAARFWRDAGQGGSIVNVVVVIDRGIPGIAHSVAARAGVIGAVRTLAVEWAPLDIRVNCVAPGLTATKGLDVYPPEAVKEFAGANPMRRPATAMEIAEACIYLSAPSASFITGEVLTVDGGGKLWGELWTAGRPATFERRES
jgi:citronellol/citronellal dehydrogenase